MFLTRWGTDSLI